VMVFALVLASCTGDDDDANGSNGDTGDTPQAEYEGTITFADLDWVSPVIHNRIAQFILENGYGYETDTIPGTTQPMFQGMVTGDIDVSMEIWVQQLPPYLDAVENGEVVDLGLNFSDTPQGWYVPTYMLEGDDDRGIEPVAPDLRHVDDLPEYKMLFEDDENPGMGRLYIGVPGWELTEINYAKMEAYGLDEHFNGFLPGSTQALMASLVAAYEQGEPWIGHLWEPHWILAQLDMTRIEEPEYTDECWEQVYEGEVGCAYPNVEVHISANAEFAEQAPEVIEFLENYETSTDLTNQAMLYMEENDVSEDEAALWFLREHEDVWSAWVDDDVADRVREALNNS
jgi:glycine betaine/proline transport system substrate-binding protein